MAEARNTSRLEAGPLSADFCDGNMRAIRWHGYEVVRGISYLVRDENWGNYPLEIQDLAVDLETGFSLRYLARAVAPSGAQLAISVVITGSADGRLVFDAIARADADFSTNRCGFCILHPIIGVAGHPVVVEHVDGTIENAVFPELIDPAQPFKEIRAITHRVTQGVTAECRMDGNIFEMEDQRNWTDASYKTYVRPLALPWPYTIPGGQSDHQRISLTLSGTPAAPAIRGKKPIRLELGGTCGAMPGFGLGIRPSDIPATRRHIDALKEIAPGHLILAFDPRDGHGLADLQGYAEICAAVPAEATLEYVLPCRNSPAQELQEAALILKDSVLKLSAIAICPAPDLKSTPPGATWPPCPPLEEIYTAARAAFPDLLLGGGMFSYFTELNRKRPPVDLIDFITHTTSPLVHAADDQSVMETLEALPFVTRSVRAFAGAKPYRIGPSAIGMRHNPYGKGVDPNAMRAKITMAETDPRQSEPFAAAWAIGYAAATLDARLDVLAIGSLTGPFGVLDDEHRHPAFNAVAALSRLSGRPARTVDSADPAKVLALVGGDTLLVANLTSEDQEVEAGLLRFSLAPYGIASHRVESA